MAFDKSNDSINTKDIRLKGINVWSSSLCCTRLKRAGMNQTGFRMSKTAESRKRKVLRSWTTAGSTKLRAGNMCGMAGNMKKMQQMHRMRMVIRRILMETSRWQQRVKSKPKMELQRRTQMIRKMERNKWQRMGCRKRCMKACKKRLGGEKSVRGN